jgi:PAS domain S-box-containing protein
MELICRFLPDGTYTFVNGAVCRGLHRSAEDLVGPSFWDFLPAEGHAALREYLSSITPARPVASREHEVTAPGGDLRWQYWTTRGFFDENGTVTEYQAVGRDITERKRAEDEHRQLEAQRQTERVLRASEERFRSLADNAPVLIWMSGLRNEAVYFNKPWLDFTGRSLEEELGFGWIESIHQDDRQHASKSATRHSRAGAFGDAIPAPPPRWRVPLDLDNGFLLRGQRCIQRLRRKLRGHHISQAGRGGARASRPSQGRVPGDARARAPEPAGTDRQCGRDHAKAGAGGRLDRLGA